MQPERLLKFEAHTNVWIVDLSEVSWKGRFLVQIWCSALHNTPPFGHIDTTQVVDFIGLQGAM